MTDAYAGRTPAGPVGAGAPPTPHAGDLHTDAVRLLTAWSAPGPEQDQLRRDYLEHLAGNPDGVWRSCAPAHLTAGAVILDPSGHRTALVLHGRINLWVQPGGHCEPGDHSVAAAAHREAEEETGLAGLEMSPEPILLSRHRAPCAVADTHLDVQFLATAPPDGEPVVSEESHDVRWFPVTDLPRELALGVEHSVAAAVAAQSRA